MDQLSEVEYLASVIVFVHWSQWIDKKPKKAAEFDRLALAGLAESLFVWNPLLSFANSCLQEYFQVF